MLSQTIINITAAVRILTAKLGQFGKLMNLEKLVHVRGKIYNAVYWFLNKGKITRCAHFLSVSQFEENFTETRKQNSQLLTVTPHHCDEWHFTVKNPEKQTQYQVETRHPYLPCTCQDYARQRGRNYTGQPIACKHGYAVLNFLGFSSLEDYVTNYKGLDGVQINEAIEYQYEAWQDARACLGF